MYLSMPSIPLHLQYAALMNCRWYMIILPDSIIAAVAAVADLIVAILSVECNSTASWRCWLLVACCSGA